MKKKLVFLFVFVLAVSVFTAGCGSRGEVSTTDTEGEELPKITIRIAYDVSETHPSHIAVVDIIKPRLEEGSGGNITLEVYPNSTLGSVQENIEAMRIGGLEMCWASDAALAGAVPEFNLVGIPFLFQSIDAAHNALDGDFGKELDRVLEEKTGIINLGYGDVGFRNITNSKKEIRVPEDLKGMKIRTMTNTLHVEYFTALGAVPTPMSFSELFTALQQKTVDAQENPTAMIWNNKLYEVQKYMSISEHIWSAAPVIVAGKFYDSLPEEYRTLIADAVTEALEFQRQSITEQNTSYVKNIQDAGLEVVALTPEEKAMFQKIAEDTVYKTAITTYGQEMVDMAQKYNN